MLRANPRDAKTLSTAWRVYLAASQFEKALVVGDELIRIDPTAGDTAFYIRNAAAAAAISPTRGEERVALGLARYPNNVTLFVIQANVLNKLGQTGRALSAINRALASHPRVEGGYAQKALILSAMNEVDSVLATIRLGAANGADKNALAQVALKAGSDSYKIGKASKRREDLQHAVDLLSLSNELEGSTDAKFLAGASAFLFGQSAINEAQDKKNCNLARLAKKSFARAQEDVPAGLQSYPDAALQLLKAIPQFDEAVDKQIQRFCK